MILKVLVHKSTDTLWSRITCSEGGKCSVVSVQTRSEWLGDERDDNPDGLKTVCRVQGAKCPPNTLHMMTRNPYSDKDWMKQTCFVWIPCSLSTATNSHQQPWVGPISIVRKVKQFPSWSFIQCIKGSLMSHHVREIMYCNSVPQIAIPFCTKLSLAFPLFW